MTESATLDLLLSWSGNPTGGGATLGCDGPTAWSAALSVTSLQPGDRILMTRAGAESAQWAETATRSGFEVVCVDVPPGQGPSLGALTHLLWWDASIAAVFVARDETSTGVRADILAVRGVLDLTGSEALLLVDCAASWSAEPLPQAGWRADLVVTRLGAPGSQPGSASLLTWSHRMPGMAAISATIPPLTPATLEDLQTSLAGPQPPTSTSRRQLAAGFRRGLGALGLEPCATRAASEVLTVAYLPPTVDLTRLEAIVSTWHDSTVDILVDSAAGPLVRVWHHEHHHELDYLAALATVELVLDAAGHGTARGAAGAKPRVWFDDWRSGAA